MTLRRRRPAGKGQPFVWCEMGQVRLKGIRAGCGHRALGRFPEGPAVCRDHLRASRRCAAFVGEFALCGEAGVVRASTGLLPCRKHLPSGAARTSSA